MNTIHFKAPWEVPIDPQGTRSAPFHLNHNEQIQVAMMMSESGYPYGDVQELNATVVILPYKVSRLA